LRTLNSEDILKKLFHDVSEKEKEKSIIESPSNVICPFANDYGSLDDPPTIGTKPVLKTCYNFALKRRELLLLGK